MTAAEFIVWWNMARKGVSNWAMRGIVSRKHGELLERLALEEDPQFDSECEMFFAFEANAPR